MMHQTNQETGWETALGSSEDPKLHINCLFLCFWPPTLKIHHKLKRTRHYYPILLKGPVSKSRLKTLIILVYIVLTFFIFQSIGAKLFATGASKQVNPPLVNCFSTTLIQLGHCVKIKTECNQFQNLCKTDNSFTKCS